MKTELKRRIRSGFFLNEVELTRLKDSQNDQIKKINGGDDAQFSFELRYQNGVVAEPADFHSIFAEENDGTKAITTVTCVAKNHTQTAEIHVKFARIVENNEEYSPIYYSVTSPDKDWTFITSSIMDERLSKIKMSKIVNWLWSDRILFFIITAVFGCSLIYLARQAFSAGAFNEENLQAAFSKSKSVKEYVYRSDLLQIKQNDSLKTLPILMIGGPFVVGFIPILWRLIIGIYPRYTFYWGDNVKKYDLRANIVKAVFTLGIVAVIAGLITNYIYDRI